MSSKTIVVVRVSTTVDEGELHEDDKDIAGDYSVELSECVPEDKLADAALDVFNSKVAIKSLEDFSFEALNDGAPLATNPDHESYTLSEMGVLID